MINKDALNNTQLEIAQRIANAAKEGNQEDFENGIIEMFTNIHDEIIDEAASMQSVRDATVLAQRGIRQLTSAERSFYVTLIDAMKASGSNNAMMALTNVDKALPLTIITQVMEDMKQNHPLLAAVNTIPVTALAKFIINVDEGKSAKWGALESAITEEIDSAFKDINMEQNKLSAWMPISIDMLELGPEWLDTYIRTCLSEALSIGFEIGIVTGTGKEMPIGMDRQVQDDVVITGGVYPQKEAIIVTDFKVSTYGDLVSRLAVNEKGKPRAVKGLILVCNPQDYFKLVFPATTYLTPDKKYVNDVLPYPTEIIQSVACNPDEAILGMGKRYILGVGGKRGIQFSDDYKFLEDKRYYKIVAYANGRAKDNNSFLRLDISGLKRLIPEVVTIDSSDF